MKAIQFHEYGGYDVLKVLDIDMPQLQQGQILVRVKYAAVKPVDNTLRKGGVKEAVKFPKTLGNEGSGVVIKGDSEFPEGARVIISCMNHAGTVRGIATPGCWQEYIAVYHDELLMTPEA